MKELDSVFVAVDGLSKCGKTTAIESVAMEANFQSEIIPNLLEDEAWQFDHSDRASLEVMQQNWNFDSITTISAGNAYRAASLYLSLLELDGVKKEEFVPADAEVVRDLLAIEGITDVLQNDPNIGSKVSQVGTMMGVHALCGSIFCDDVRQAYHANNGANLVIGDARDPVGHLQRNNLIGNRANQINPGNILSIYIDTPTYIAAQRMSGSFVDNLAEVMSRRLTDQQRAEIPVSRPENLVYEYQDWVRQIIDASDQSPSKPYCFKNGARVGLDNVQYFASLIAATAQDIAIYRKQANKNLAVRD